MNVWNHTSGCGCAKPMSSEYTSTAAFPAAALDGGETYEEIGPRTRSEARKALDGRRLTGTERTVVLRDLPHRSGTSDDLDVHGPTDGTPLVVEVRSGFHPLHIRSGNVEIRADSAFGNPINVHGDARVKIHGGHDRKVTVHASDTARVQCDFDATQRGLVFVDCQAGVHVYEPGGAFRGEGQHEDGWDDPFWSVGEPDSGGQ